MALLELRFGARLGEELLGVSAAEGLVRAEGVVGPLPVEPFLVEVRNLERARSDFIELLGLGALGAFDGAVEFGRAGREDEPLQAALPQPPQEAPHPRGRNHPACAPQEDGQVRGTRKSPIRIPLGDGGTPSVGYAVSRSRRFGLGSVDFAFESARLSNEEDSWDM